MAPTPTKPHILIGCVTYFKQAHVLDLLLQSLKKLRGAGTGAGTDFTMDVFFVDNSPGEKYYQHLQQKLADAHLPGKTMVAYDAPGLKNRIDRIITGRNVVRNEFLKNPAYTHLFFLDTDVMIPPETLVTLLAHEKPLVAGVYLSHQELPNGKSGIFPVGCLQHEKKGFVRQLKIDDVWEPRLLELAITGLGCVLMQRDVLEKVGFRNIGYATTGGEDSAFFLDAHEQGFPLFIDTRIRCDHYFYPIGDQRNTVLMFSKYRKRGEPVDMSYSFGINA